MNRAVKLAAACAISIAATCLTAPASLAATSTAMTVENYLEQGQEVAAISAACAEAGHFSPGPGFLDELEMALYYLDMSPEQIDEWISEAPINSDNLSSYLVNAYADDGLPWCYEQLTEARHQLSEIGAEVFGGEIFSAEIEPIHYVKH